MKYKYLFVVLILTIYSTCLTVFPSGSTEGAVNGLRMCYSIVIPSLFPFTVATLILFEYINAGSKRKNLTSIIMLFSFIGGYPVGSKLIENAYSSGAISKRNAELMLGYCVNSGPSFIIIVVGSGILQSKTLGFVLLSSNLLASLLLFFIYGIFLEQNEQAKTVKLKPSPASDVFVKATYDAAYSMIGICAFVVLFSSIIGLVKDIFPDSTFKTALMLILEVTNGITLCEKNIYLISFLLGFAGLSVHFQILSLCKTLKPNYLKFLLSRLLHGVLSAGTTYILIKLFKITLPAVSTTNYSLQVSENTLIFSLALILTSVIFMISVSKICRFQ